MTHSCEFYSSLSLCLSDGLFFFLSRYEMRFNMKSGVASQKKLSESAVDFPRVNESYTGRCTSTLSCSCVTNVVLWLEFILLFHILLVLLTDLCLLLIIFAWWLSCVNSGNKDMCTGQFWTALQRLQGLLNLIYMQSLNQEKERLRLEEMSKASLTLVLVDLVQRLYLSLVSQAPLPRKMMATWYSSHMMKVPGNRFPF